MEIFDSVLIPGGGLLNDGSLPPWTIARLEYALSLRDKSRWFILLSGGTVHKPPPLSESGFPVFESQRAAEYLINAGLDPKQVLTEISSYDTIGNAYFARMLFTEPMALARCLIITSAFHLPRAEAIFRWVYSLQPIQQDCSLSFLSTADEGLSPQALGARQERERLSLENLGSLIKNIGSLNTFQSWLYTEHAAYAARGEKEQLSEDELRSY